MASLDKVRPEDLYITLELRLVNWVYLDLKVMLASAAVELETLYDFIASTSRVGPYSNNDTAVCHQAATR